MRRYRRTIGYITSKSLSHCEIARAKDRRKGKTKIKGIANKNVACRNSWSYLNAETPQHDPINPIAPHTNAGDLICALSINIRAARGAVIDTKARISSLPRCAEIQ